MNKGQQQEKPREKAAERRPWSRPELIELGNVRDLTKGTSGSVSDGRGLIKGG